MRRGKLLGGHVMHRLTAAVCGIVLVAVLATGVAAAEPYGTGAYGACSYQRCDLPPTRVTLPSGLEIAVNLQDKQVIPPTGYTITVTPLNGQGRTFKHADFYVDGTLAQGDVKPDEGGTAQWLWKPDGRGDVVIKVVVTDTDGTEVTKQFAVRVGDIPAAPQPPVSTAVQPDADRPAASIFEKFSEGAEQVFRTLPRPVVYSFPYILLALMGVNLLILVLQVKRELGAYRTLQRQQRQLMIINEDKQTFMQLISHYFRTPLTVLNGGIEMLESASVPSGSVASLQVLAKRLQTTVEGLISQVSVATQPEPANQPAKTSALRTVTMLLPVMLIGLAALGFTYIAQRAGSFTISQVNITIQVVVYASLMLTTYQVFRRRQLRRYEATMARQVIASEQAVVAARDTLITGSALSLTRDVKELDAILTTLPPGKGTDFIRNGQQRFHVLAAKFNLVAGLQGAHSTAQPVQVTVGELLDMVRGQLQPQLAKRGVTLALPDNASTLTVADRQLAAYVFGSVLDNAVAFSPEKGRVEVKMQHTATGNDLTVTDHGPGIPEEKQPALFAPFTKATGVQTFDHEGLGLGLYIDKLIMDYIGGTISLTSRPGDTTVMMHLPD